MIAERDTCRCPELGRKCPACLAYAREHHQGTSTVCTVEQSIASTQHLAASHDDIVMRIAAGEAYSAIACAYDVSIEAFLSYLRRTGAYVSRQIAQREMLRTLAPLVLADYAAGMLLKDLAQKYSVSPHAIRCMRQRAEAAQSNGKET